MDAHAIVSPLPSELNFSMRTPEPGSTGEPLTVHYDTGDSGQTADIDAEVRIVEPVTSPTTCGTPGVLCAELDVRHLPAEIDATIVNVTPLDTRIAVDMVPRPGGAEPDVFASAVIAQKPDPDADPLAGPPDPMVADVSIFGLPEHMRVRMLNRIIDEGLAPPSARRSNGPSSTPARGTTTRPRLACADAEGRIDAIDFSFRNFLGPATLPALLPETPLWVTVVGRGGSDPTDSVRLEAKAHLTDIAEVQLLTNDDLLGLRTDVGGNQVLSALLDIEDIPIVFEEATDVDPAVYHRLDLDGVGRHRPAAAEPRLLLPAEGPHRPRDAHHAVHRACQNPDPFGDDDGVGNATRSPLAVAYRGTNGAGVLQEFDVRTKVDLNEKGNDDDPAPNTIDDDQHVRGFVNVLHLPGQLRRPSSTRRPTTRTAIPTDGPLRVEYNANAPLGVDQITVDFGVQVTDANFLCHDPRPMPLGKMALCAKAQIENLPTDLSLFYDPTISQNNFVLDTSGTERINVNDLEASLVEGVLEDKNIPETPDDESDDTLVTSVLVAFGYLHGLPEDVTGHAPAPRHRRRHGFTADRRGRADHPELHRPRPAAPRRARPAHRRARTGRGRPAVHRLPARRVLPGVRACHRSARHRLRDRHATPPIPSGSSTPTRSGSRSATRPRPCAPTRTCSSSPITTPTARPFRRASCTSSATSRSSTCPTRSPSASAARRRSRARRSSPRTATWPHPTRRVRSRSSATRRARSCSTSTRSCASPRPAAPTCWRPGSTWSTSRTSCRAPSAPTTAPASSSRTYENIDGDGFGVDPSGHRLDRVRPRRLRHRHPRLQPG